MTCENFYRRFLSAIFPGILWTTFLIKNEATGAAAPFSTTIQRHDSLSLVIRTSPCPDGQRCNLSGSSPPATHLELARVARLSLRGGGPPRGRPARPRRPRARRAPAREASSIVAGGEDAYDIRSSLSDAEAQGQQLESWTSDAAPWDPDDVGPDSEARRPSPLPPLRRRPHPSPRLPPSPPPPPPSQTRSVPR